MEAVTSLASGTSGTSRATAAEHLPLISPTPGYDPTVELLPKLVQILNLEFVETLDLLPDAWQDQNILPEPGQSHYRTRRQPVTEILPWPGCFGRLASVLCTRYTNKTAEFWA